MALVGLHLLILVVSELLHSGVGRQKACSCYTFEDGSQTKMTWPQAKESCEYNNKSLVAMETLQEWEFINKTIKHLTSGQFNEWHIGLFKNLANGNWTWINGKRLTIDKWRENKPGRGELFALIAREFPPGSYGLFNSIKGNVQRGWICEEETDNCEGTCTFQYPPPITTAPTRSTITELKESTRPPSTADDRTYLSESTTLPTVPSKDALEGEKNGSTTIIVAASLGALLFVALIVLAVILLLRRKKRRGKDAERPDTTASKQTESQYESVNPVEAAKLLGTPDLNATKGESPKVECEYAVVNKANKKPKKGDLVYAELADFDDSTNDEKAAQKPAPYETTVYADVVPTDVYHKASPDPSHPTYANVKSTGV